MRGTIRLVAIFMTGLGLTWLGVGCSTTVEVDFAQREEFSRYRTWSWLPLSRSYVDAPHADEAALDAQLARLIEQALLESGLERGGDDADLFVNYRLALPRRKEPVNVPRAPYLLSSHHSSASYWIEGTSQKALVAEDVHLAIGFVDPSGRMVWRGTLVRRGQAGVVLPVDDAVATLCGRFPRREAAGAPD
jgi:hypothetical protein